MNDKEFSELLRSGEQPNIEYKSEWYDINSASAETKERQRGELMKDIVALANGNVTSAGKTAYLIVGVSDKPNDKGERGLFDVGEMGDLSALRQTMLQCLKEKIRPPIDDVRLELFTSRGQRILIITIPPTPFLHEPIRPLKVSGGGRESYDENTVIIRRGEDVGIATSDERQAIAERKKFAFKESRKVYPARFGVIVGAIVSGSLAAITSPKLMSRPDTLQLRLTGFIGGAVVGCLLGWYVGKLYEMALDLRFSWYRLPTIKRLVLLSLLMVSVLYTVYAILYSTQ